MVNVGRLQDPPYINIDGAWDLNLTERGEQDWPYCINLTGLAYKDGWRNVHQIMMDIAASYVAKMRSLYQQDQKLFKRYLHRSLETFAHHLAQTQGLKHRKCLQYLDFYQHDFQWSNYLERKWPHLDRQSTKIPNQISLDQVKVYKDLRSITELYGDLWTLLDRHIVLKPRYLPRIQNILERAAYVE